MTGVYTATFLPTKPSSVDTLGSGKVSGPTHHYQ